MTTQTYIPTETELNEMGFLRHVNGCYSFHINKKFTIELFFGKWKFYCDSGKQLESLLFYPSDKAHLQSIILSFNPK